MDPVLKAILSSWDLRIDVIIILATAGILYSSGWWQLRQRARTESTLTRPWRIFTYLSGLLLVALALMSPIDPLGQQLFLMHMKQHLLLIMVAPPLLLVANPMPFILWGLPRPLRLGVGRGLSKLLHKQSPFRNTLRTITTPGVVWLIWVVSVLGWHDPNAYNAALTYSWVHDIEHLFFFWAGMLFWWHVTGAGPRIHKQFGVMGRIAFVLGGVPPNMFTGIWLAFSRDVVYTYYMAVPRLWNISVMTDQQIGGIIMWIPGSMMYILACLIPHWAFVTKGRPKTCFIRWRVGC